MWGNKSTPMKNPFLIQEIGDALKSLNGSSFVIYSLHIAVDNGTLDTALTEVYEQSKYHRQTISQLLGEDLLQKVETCFI